MGKAKPQRKSGALSSTQPYSLSSSSKESFQISELEQNLSSPDDSTRLNALSILSDLYKFSSKKNNTFKLLSSNKFLSKLLVRLVDHNLQIVKSAALCLKSITDLKDETSIQNMIDSGIFKAIISKVVSSPLNSDIEIEIIQSYLYTISNIITINSESIDEIVEENSPFISFLVNLLINPNIDLRLLNTICNVLTNLTKIQSDLLINTLLGANCVSEIIKLLKGLVTKKLGSASLKAENLELKDEDYDLWVLVIQCIEMLTNLFLNPVLATNIEQLIPISYIHQVQFHLLNGCKVTYTPKPLPNYSEQNNVEFINEDDLDSELANLNKVSEHFQGLNNQASTTFMCDVEIVEMISDLIASSTQQVLAILPELDEDSSNNAVINTLQSSPLYTRCINFLNIFEGSFDMNKCLSIIIFMKNKFYQCFTDVEGNSENKLITPDGVRIMESVEKFISSINESLGLKTYLLNIMHSNVSNFTLNLQLYGEYFSFLYESVVNTTTLVNNKKAEEKWKTVENEEGNKLKKIFVTQSSLFFDIFSIYNSVSSTNNTLQTHPNKKLSLSTDEFKGVVSNLLNWISVPQYEIIASFIQCLSVFINDAFVSTHKEIFNQLLTFIISNSILNRMNDPYCFQIENIFEENLSNQQEAFLNEEELKLKKNTNLKNVNLSKLLLWDLLVNFYIDFHSSDDLPSFQIFMKLNSIDKLYSIFQNFSSSFKKFKKFLNVDEKEKIMESLENLEAFIDYKRNFRC